MSLPPNFINISIRAALNILTVRRFAEDAKALMAFIANAKQYDLENPDDLMELFSKSGDYIENHIRMSRELAAIHEGLCDLVEGGNWPADEPEPVFLSDAVAKQGG